MPGYVELGFRRISRNRLGRDPLGYVGLCAPFRAPPHAACILPIATVARLGERCRPYDHGPSIVEQPVDIGMSIDSSGDPTVGVNDVRPGQQPRGLPRAKTLTLATVRHSPRLLHSAWSGVVSSIRLAHWPPGRTRILPVIVIEPLSRAWQPSALARRTQVPRRPSRPGPVTTGRSLNFRIPGLRLPRSPGYLASEKKTFPPVAGA
jgi:hypothetical protein